MSERCLWCSEPATKTVVIAGEETARACKDCAREWERRPPR